VVDERIDRSIGMRSVEMGKRRGGKRRKNERRKVTEGDGPSFVHKPQASRNCKVLSK
jgi:hypothetical protein